MTKRIVLGISICAVVLLAGLVLRPVHATTTLCIGPGPCVVPVSPPSTCIDGGAPGTPFSEAIYTATAGQKAVLQITPSPNCQLVVSSIEAALVGSVSTTEIANFVIWQTNDASCGNPDGTVWFAEDMAIGPSFPADHLTIGGTGAIVVSNSNQNVCIGFPFGLSNAYETFNATFASR
jgi:hypothetical protein